MTSWLIRCARLSNLQTGSKPIFHLEAFIAKFMSIYKVSLVIFSRSF